MSSCFKTELFYLTQWINVKNYTMVCNTSDFHDTTRQDIATVTRQTETVNFGPLVFFLPIPVIAFAVVFLWFIRAHRPPNFPPGPKPYPFIGNLHICVNNEKFHQTLHQLAEKHGGILGLQMTWYPVVVVSDLKILKEMLITQQEIFSDRPRDHPYFKMIFKGQGLLLQNGESWKTLRKMAVSSLSKFGLRSDSLESSIQTEAVILLNEVERYHKSTLEIRNLFHKAVSNIICSALFGKRFDYTGKAYEGLVDALDFIFQQGGFQNPYLFLPMFTFVMMPFTQPQVFESIQKLKTLRTFISNQIEEHRVSFDPSNQRDFVDMYLEAKRCEGTSDIYTEGNMFHVMMDLFMAGTETISQTMKWAFLFLIKYPTVQDRCRQEILKVIGDSRLPCIKDRADMPYIEATISEIQRFTVSLGILHNSNQTTEVEGYTIPKNTLVITNLHAIHQNPEHWPNPQEFRPERFLTEMNTYHRPPGYVSFGIGRRACPGESLVRHELFIFLTSLLQRYKFKATMDLDKLPGHEQGTLGITLEAPQYELKAVKL